MIRKYGTGIIALVIAISAVAFRTDRKQKPLNKDSDVINYFYRFTGNHGSEDTMSYWVQLTDEEAYDLVNCPNGNDKGCKIKNTTNLNGHPTSVPLNVDKVPIVSSPNVALQNRPNN